MSKISQVPSCLEISRNCNPSFGESVNPIPIRGADYAKHISTSPPDFWTVRRPCSFSPQLWQANGYRASAHQYMYYNLYSRFCIREDIIQRNMLYWNPIDISSALVQHSKNRHHYTIPSITVTIAIQLAQICQQFFVFLPSLSSFNMTWNTKFLPKIIKPYFFVDNWIVIRNTQTKIILGY